MEKILKEIEAVRKKTYQNLEEKESKQLRLYKQLSVFLFNAVKENDNKTIIKILSLGAVSAKNLTDEDGYNIIEHSLVHFNNKLFYFLYEDLYDYVNCCFTQIPELFTITFKRENFELVRFFLNNFGKYLNKINIVECLFKAIEKKQEEIVKIILDDFSEFIDSRNIQAAILYFISYDKVDALKLLFSYQNLTNKILDRDIEKIFLLSILNKNDKIIELLLSQKYFSNSLMRLNKNIIKSISNLACETKNVIILENLQKLLK